MVLMYQTPTWRAATLRSSLGRAPKVSYGRQPAAKTGFPKHIEPLGPDHISFPVQYGIELEMSGPGLSETRQGVAHALGSGCTERPGGVIDPHGRLWQVKPEEAALVEVASPVLDGFEGLQQVQHVASTMTDIGAVSGNEAGTHCHVDARDMDVPHMIRLVSLLSRHERDLYKALGVHGERGRYCMPMERQNVAHMLGKPATSREAFCKQLRGPHVERGRGLNVENLLNRSSKITLEFRYFNGTLDPLVIGCYVGLVMGLVHYALASRRLPDRSEATARPSLPALLQQIDLPPEHPVSAWLMRRPSASRKTPGC